MADSDEARDPVEQLIEEYTRRLRNGEHPSISEYAQQYPEYADEIREVFPTVAVMERLGSHEAAEREAAQQQPASPAPDRIGDYRIVKEIGRGGMGIVYEAQQESLGRSVAIKVLAASAMASPRQVQRFIREARAAASLHHTNIVPIFGFGEENGRHYYVMQLIQGVSLDTIVRAAASEDGEQKADDGSRTTTPSSVARIGLQLADALDYAHRQGVLHRDIKPANLLLDEQGTVWITDFGLAKRDGHDAITEASDIVGTVRYMAPEQFNGPADKRSDIYSLGLTLYEMLTLTAAFGQAGYAQLMHRKTTGTPASPRMIDPAIPRDLETIVLKACAAAPADRYQTAGELADDLERFLDDRPIQARRTTPAERLWRWARRNPAVATLSAAALSLLVTVAVVSAVGHYRARHLLTRVAAERTRAEANLQLAIEAFDNIINRVASRGLPQSFELDLGVDPSSIEQAAITPADAELLQSLLAFFADFAQRNQVDLRPETANAYRRIGDIRLRLGQFQEAQNAYKSALETYAALEEKEPDDPAFPLARAGVLDEIGVVCSLRGDWQGAMKAHSQAREVLVQMPASGSKKATQFELARTLNLLTSVVGRSEIATLFGSIRAGAEETSAPFMGLTRQRASLMRRGIFGLDRLLAASANLRNPRVAQADAYCRQAEQLLLDLVQQQPDNTDYRVELSKCYRNAVRLQSVEGRFEQAEDSLQKAIDILDRLVRDYPDKPQLQYHLADVLCLTVPQSTTLPQERQRIVQATLMCQRLTSIFPNVPEYQTLMAGAWIKLADLQYDANELDDAEHNYMQAATSSNALVQRSPDVFLYRLLCIRSWIGLADLKRDRGQLQAALEAINSAISLHETDAKPHQNRPLYWRLTRLLYVRQARVLSELGRPFLATQALMKARSEPTGTPSGDAHPN